MRFAVLSVIALLSVSEVFSQTNVYVDKIPLVPGDSWSSAMSWDKNDGSLENNSATILAGELIIGDASSQYRASNVRTYFRFLLPGRLSGKTILYTTIKLVCSYGGDDKPMLAIHYVDISNPPSLGQNPDQLPLSGRMILWVENWQWKTGEMHNTPNLSSLLLKFLEAHGPGEIMIAIASIGKPDSFKGIVSPATDPKNAPVLIVTYMERSK